MKTIPMMLLLGSTSWLCGSSPAIASAYLGQFCWQLHLAENQYGEQDLTLDMVAGVSHVGDNYFSLQGMIEVPSDVGNDVIVQGSAVAGGGQVHLIMNSFQDNRSATYDQTLWSGTAQALLSISTLSGEFLAVDAGFDLPGKTGVVEYWRGTLTFAPCP